MHSPTDGVALYSRWHEVSLLRVYCYSHSEWFVVVLFHSFFHTCETNFVFSEKFAILTILSVAPPGVGPGGGVGTIAPTQKSLTKIKFVLLKKYLLQILFQNALFIRGFPSSR